MPDPMLELRRRWLALKEREAVRTLRAMIVVLNMILVIVYFLIVALTSNYPLLIPAALFGIVALLNFVLWKYF